MNVPTGYVHSGLSFAMTGIGISACGGGGALFSIVNNNNDSVLYNKLVVSAG